MHLAAVPDKPLEDYVIADPYEDWIKREGIKHIVDYAFDDLKTLDLGPWERKGGSGAVISIPNEQLRNDSHVIEIKPGGKSEPEHHLYEEVVYVLSGLGATTVWMDEKRKRTFEWNEGSVFALPLNAWYQHFNGSGSKPARYIAMTSAPPMMRLFRDVEFIWNNPVMFKSRYLDEEDYFSGKGKLYNHRIWESNFVPNAATMGLYSWKERGAGSTNAMLEMAHHSIRPHISEFPVGTYKKAHQHDPGAHLLLLRGTSGYSLLWKEGAEPRIAPWKEGAMVIVPWDDCIHQHFNTGSTPARYLAMAAGFHGLYKPGWTPKAVSKKQGGHQIEYEDEDPAIHKLLEAELKKHGAPCRMKAFIPGCTGEVGPTNERDT